MFNKTRAGSCVQKKFHPFEVEDGVSCSSEIDSLSERIINTDIFEIKRSTERERGYPISQTQNDVNSSETRSAPYAQPFGSVPSGFVNKNTRSFGNRSRSNNYRSKRNSKSHVHENSINSDSGFQKRAHNFRHRNAPFIPNSFDLAFPPTQFFPFSVQDTVYPTETFHSNHLPDWHRMDHQGPRMKKWLNNPQSRQFPGCMPNYRPCQEGKTLQPASTHGVERRARSSVPRGLPQEGSCHSQPLTRKINLRNNQVKNPEAVTETRNDQLKTNSTKRNMSGCKQEVTLETNNQSCDHKLKQSESLQSINPVKNHDKVGESFKIKSSRFDHIKKKCRQMQSAPYDDVRCNDNATLQKDCFQLIAEPNIQQISRLQTGHSYQKQHPQTDSESHSSRSCPEMEQFLKGHIYNFQTNGSQTSEVDNVCTLNSGIKLEYISKNLDCRDTVNNQLTKSDINEATNNDYAHILQTDQTIERQAFCEAQERLLKSKIWSALKTFPSLQHSSVHPSQDVQNDRTIDHCPVPCFTETTEIEQSSECTSSQFTASYRNVHPNNNDHEIGQIELTFVLESSLSNLSEESPSDWMNDPDHNDRINDLLLNAHESNDREMQIKDLTTDCHESDSNFLELNPMAASFRLAIKDEIAEEMARAKRMLIPVNVDSKKSTQLLDSSLNPSADEFCPKLIDCYGNSFAMVKQKGICYFLPDTAHSRLKTSQPGSDKNVDIRSPAGGVSESVYHISAPMEAYNLNEYTPATTIDITFSQTFEKPMESSQYSGNGHSYTDLNAALIDTCHVNPHDVYLTDSIISSPITSVAIPELSFQNDNHIDPLTNYSNYNPIYYFTQPYTDCSNMLHLDSHTSALLTAPWKEHMNKTQASFGSPGAFYSMSPMLASSPVASSPMAYGGSGHTQIVLQTQPVPYMLQVPMSAHALPTLCNPQLHSVIQPTNPMLSQAPVFNLQAFYETAQDNSPVLNVNNSDGINNHSEGISSTQMTIQSDPRSCVSNFVTDAQFNSVNERRSEMGNEICSNTFHKINHCRTVGSTDSSLGRQVVDHDDGARGRHQFDTASCTDVRACFPQTCPTSAEIDRTNEYNECLTLMHRLCDGDASLENFRRNVLSEHPVIRDQIHSLFDLALRIKEINQNNLTVSEMAASMVLLSSIYGSTTFTNMLPSIENN